MAWDLDQAKANFLASSLKGEIASNFSSDDSKTKRVSVPISSIALACEYEIQEETKLNSLLAALSAELGWTITAYLMNGVVEFHG